MSVTQIRGTTLVRISHTPHHCAGKALELYVWNRVAHHEPLLNGVPLRGQTHRNEKRRRTVEEAFAQILSLARMIDTDLATWLVANSEVPGVMSRKCEITSSLRSFNNYGLE